MYIVYILYVRVSYVFISRAKQYFGSTLLARALVLLTGNEISFYMDHRGDRGGGFSQVGGQHRGYAVQDSTSTSTSTAATAVYGVYGYHTER